jgi:hypothetical protein
MDGGEEECIYDFGWKSGRKETTRKTKTWRVDNIKMDVTEIG